MILISSFQRIAIPFGSRDGLVVAERTRLYPALLLLYSAGIAAVAAEKYDILLPLFTKAKVRDASSEVKVISCLYPTSVINLDWARMLPGMERRRTPLNDRLHQVLRKSFGELLPDDEAFERTFAMYEYLFALLYIEIEGRTWVPVGRFAWKDCDYPYLWFPKKVETEVADMGKDWPPLKAGLFGGDLARFQAAQKFLYEFMARLRWGH